MQFMLMIFGNEKREAKLKPADMQRVFGAYMQYSKELRAAGAYVAGDPLQPTTKATSVTVRKGKTAKRPGPAYETKEQFGGYYVIEAKTMAEAVKWAAKCPGSWDGTVEVRPIMKMG